MKRTLASALGGLALWSWAWLIFAGLLLIALPFLFLPAWIVLAGWGAWFALVAIVLAIRDGRLIRGVEWLAAAVWTVVGALYGLAILGLIAALAVAVILAAF